MPGQLTRYAGKRSLSRAFGSSAYYAVPAKYRMAARAAGHVYSNRKRYGAAARVIGRAYKKYRKYRADRARIGQRVGKATAKRHLNVTAGPVLQNTWQLHTDALGLLARGANGDQRERNIVNLRGFRICWQLVNQVDEPLMCNVMVVCSKTGAPPAMPFGVDWFRGFNAERSRDFSTGSNSMAQHCDPVNTDNWTVLKHSRFTIGTNTGAGGYTTNAPPNNWRMRKWYIPIRRQINFDDATPASTNQRFYLIHYCHGLQNPSSTPTLSFQWREHVVTYFKEPKN